MSRPIALLAIGVLTVISHACEKVPLLAPTGSTVTLSVSDESRMPLNGTRQVTAIVIESSGTAPQNGTVVTFAADLGRFEPIEARTTNGLATSTFHSGNRSGTATIRAFSGGAGTGDSEATATILIGGAGLGTVLLRTESSAGAGTSVVVVATVLDADGNPVPGVAVAFSADRGQVSPGVAAADGNGEARATVTTSQETVVTATAGAASGTITISAPGTLALTFGEGTTTPPFEVGRPINFTVTPSGTSFFSNVVVDFGDGSAPMNLGAVSGPRTFTYTFTRRGNFIVTASATSATGTTTSSSLAVQVNDEAPLNVQIAVSPSTTVSLALNTVTTYTVTVTFGASNPAIISSVEWSFGDGVARTTTGTSTSYRHTATGTFTVTANVFSTDGRRGTGLVTVRVTP